MQKAVTLFVILFMTAGFISVTSAENRNLFPAPADSLETEVTVDTTVSSEDEDWWKMDKKEKKKKAEVKKKNKKDNNYVEDEWMEWNWDEDWDMDFNVWNSDDNPTITVMYGQGGFKQDYLSDMPFGELRLGYGGTTVHRRRDYLTNYDASYLTYSIHSATFGEKKDAALAESKLTRFGMGWDKGYGYNLGGKASLNLYNTFGIGWSKLELVDSVTGPVNYNYLSDYRDAFRFGIRGEAGISLSPIPNLSFNAGYERAIVYPRVLFWKTAGSLLAESVAGWAVEEFVDRILYNSPAVAPVMNFILRSALIYGAYELRRDESNFPFNGVEPVAHDTFKFGISFIF
jgi:opacity protein-like surface antigen